MIEKIHVQGEIHNRLWLRLPTLNFDGTSKDQTSAHIWLSMAIEI